MTGHIVFALALALGVSAASAQEPACSLYQVDTRMLNISKEAGGETYIDVLVDGEVACVTRKQKVNGSDRGYVAHKLAKPDGRTPVNGWAALRYLKPLSPGEAAAGGAGAESAVPAARPAVVAAAPAVAVPAPATVDPEDVLRFDQPIGFGPFPVNGQSIKTLAEAQPLFSPLDGLDESQWRKPCGACHKWDQAKLCEQGKSYAKSAKAVLRHPHPFGGAFKIAVMKWAKGGCN